MLHLPPLHDIPPVRIVTLTCGHTITTFKTGGLIDCRECGRQNLRVIG